MRICLYLFFISLMSLRLLAESSNMPKEFQVLNQFRNHTTAALSQHGLPDVLRDHFVSLRSLVDQAEVRRGQVPLDETIRYVEGMNAGLELDAMQPDTYLKWGRRSLVFTFSSEVDGSLQYYACTLPPNYNPEKAYPLIVDLHGAGPDHPLFYVFIHIANPPDMEKYLMPRTSNPDTDVIMVRPWGRGNQGYRGAAGEDIRQSMEDVARRFKVDSNRYYLKGHSMGGFAVWQIAARYPEVWAAACILAGGAGNGPHLAKQMASLPVRIWTGAEDKSVHPDNAHLMERLLREAGNEHVSLRVVEGWGHEPPSTEEGAENLRWLLQFSK